MTISEAYRWRKISDINREHALFELLEDETPVLDVGFTDDGVFEIAFHPAISGKVMRLDRLQALLREGKALAEDDR